MELKKECFFRHGPFKLIKIEKCFLNQSGNENNNYQVERFVVFQECKTCGKTLSYSQMTKNDKNM